MKNILKIGLLCFVLVLIGCSQTEDTTKDETEEPTITIQENQLYASPKEATNYQIELYNALTEAIEENDDEKIAESVAVNFIADFFTLKNKENVTDIGGLVYIPLHYRDAFQDFASAYVYAQYPVLVDEYGKTQLFEVQSITVENMTPQTFVYSQYIEEEVPYYEELNVEGYAVEVSVAYQDTKIPEDQLKTSATVQVIPVDGAYMVIGLD